MTKTANIHNEPPGPRARLPKLIVGCVRLRLVRPYLGCCQAQVPRCAFFTSLTLPGATPNSPNDSVLAVVRLLAVRRPVLPSPLPFPAPSSPLTPSRIPTSRNRTHFWRHSSAAAHPPGGDGGAGGTHTSYTWRAWKACGKLSSIVRQEHSLITSS